MLGKSLYVGETVELTAIDTEKDAATFSKWTERSSFFRRFTDGMFRIIPEHEMKKKLAEKLKNAEEKRNAYYFAIRKKEDAALIGFACIGWTIPAHQVGGIQIDFGEESDLVNFGDEVMRLMLRYGFMEAGLHRLMTTFPTYETEQIALFERSGFLREVQHREAAYHEGRYWDKVEYALLKPEYKKQYHEEAK